MFPEHCVWPGAQLPVHTPLMHVWFEHVLPAVHVPLVLHVSGALEAQLT